MRQITPVSVPEQNTDMDLPPNQDVIQPDILAWNGGPLSDQSLEQIAFELFRFKYPCMTFDNSLCKGERDECRRLALQLRVKFLKLDRWTIENCVEHLTDQSCHLVYGDRRLGSTIRNQVKDFCESFIEDLARIFPGKLFYPRQVEANDDEVKRETH